MLLQRWYLSQVLKKGESGNSEWCMCVCNIYRVCVCVCVWMGGEKKKALDFIQKLGGVLKSLIGGQILHFKKLYV